MISIREIDHTGPAYVDLALKLGSVFNQSSWLDLYGTAITVNGIFNLNNELIGAFNVFKAKKFGQAYLIVPPYSPSNGLFFKNPAENNSNRITYEKAVHEAICGWFEGQSAFIKLTAFPTSVNDTQIYYWKNYKVIPNYTYQLPLSKTEEDLFADMTTEKRKSIKKAVKDGLEIKLCTDLSVVRSLILKTFDRKDKTVDQDFLRKILERFATAANSFAFVAYLNGKPSACTFCVHDANTSYYLFGGYDNQNKHHGAGPGCMWQSILYARNRGIRIFDFEGSMLPEVEKYFREFGGSLVPYYKIQKAPLPVEIMLKMKMRNRF